MAETTPKPPPPLPFGGSPAEGPKTLFTDRTTLFTGENGATVTDVTNLIGAKVFDTLNIRGEIGYKTGQFTDSSAVVNNTRQPWVLTCQKWVEQGRYILARVNPKEVQWRMPQRSVAQKTRRGEILHIWRDRFRGTFYDEPQLQITFQSGNIMPIRYKSLVRDTTMKKQVGEAPSNSGQSYVKSQINDAARSYQREQKEINTKLNSALSPGLGSGGGPTEAPRWKNDPTETEPVVPEGLSNFYAFLELVDEQKILDTGDINYVYIIYNSRIFPNLTLAGLFTPEGVSWSDSAEDPNQVGGWGANFTIYDSFPKLNDYNALTKFFQSAGFGRV